MALIVGVAAALAEFASTSELLGEGERKGEEEVVLEGTILPLIAPVIEGAHTVVVGLLLALSDANDAVAEMEGMDTVGFED